MTTGQDTPGQCPFDLIGERYEQSFQDRAAQVAEGDWLIGTLPAGARVLDVGCGSGVPTARQLSDAGLTVVGIDESATMLRLAGSRVPAATFVRQDVRALGPELGEFDAAVSFFALLMLGRKEIPAVLRAIRARLRGPRLLSLAMVLGDFDLAPISFFDVPLHVTAYPADQLAAVVSDAGFEVTGLRQVRAKVAPGRTESQVYLRAVATD
ncbi:class I SAM-dependent methyltransferase [Gandjariella thermophila]|uniref:class I SAM-dependent methyltransferase n=1 Tax=Gandjariella thermophila TaxID=1931992 RepID=UPI00186420A4|nr:class I SAM-dependent methyltransferase [Gandjariella thermophila]